jgi:hypothetical protein
MHHVMHVDWVDKVVCLFSPSRTNDMHDLSITENADLVAQANVRQSMPKPTRCSYEQALVVHQSAVSGCASHLLHDVIHVL